MVAQSQDHLLEVEISSTDGANLFFLPIDRVLRGRLDFMAPLVRNDAAMPALSKRWADKAIPGQVVGIDLATSEGYLREPLHEPEHAMTAARARDQRFLIPPEREEFQHVDVPTWLYWLKRAVESGNARIVKGTLPEKIDGTPKLSLFRAQQDPGEIRIDKLCGAVEQLVGLVGELIKAQTSKSR